MKMIKHTNGFTVSFGFDVFNRRAEPGAVFWDNGSGDWDPSTRYADSHHAPNLPITPEFVIEHRGKILAYQPGMLVEMIYVGPPAGWHFAFYRAD